MKKAEDWVKELRGESTPRQIEECKAIQKDAFESGREHGDLFGYRRGFKEGRQQGKVDAAAASYTEPKDL